MGFFKYFLQVCVLSLYPPNSVFQRAEVFNFDNFILFCVCFL